MSNWKPINVQLSADHLAACERIGKRLGIRARAEVIRRAIVELDEQTAAKDGGQ